MNFGVQGNFNLTSSLKMIGGIVFSPTSNLNSDFTTDTIRNYNYTGTSFDFDTLAFSNNKYNYSIPSNYGFGASFIYKEKLVFGIDYTTQDWSKAKFFNTIDSRSLQSDNHFSIGCQFTPDKGSFRSYFERIRYRAGAYYNDTYIKYNNNSITDIGFSVGLGLPLRNGKSMFNIGSEFGRKGTTDALQIDYSRITFSLILYDNWFFKRKYD
jgi:hypothetical protein